MNFYMFAFILIDLWSIFFPEIYEGNSAILCIIVSVSPTLAQGQEMAIAPPESSDKHKTLPSPQRSVAT